MMKQDKTQTLGTDLFKQLSNKNKVAILQYLLSAKIASAKVIQKEFNFRQPAVSKYLKALIQYGLVEKMRIGSMTIYTVKDTVRVKLENWILT